MKSFKKKLLELGYGIEMRRIEGPRGFGITHIRTFESKGVIAKIARFIERVI